MVNMAKLAWTFDLLPDSTTFEADIKTDFTDGFLTCPKQFPIRFIPRSEKHREVVLREFESAKSVFARYED